MIGESAIESEDKFAHTENINQEFLIEQLLENLSQLMTSSAESPPAKTGTHTEEKTEATAD